MVRVEDWGRESCFRRLFVSYGHLEGEAYHYRNHGQEEVLPQEARI